MKERRKKEKTVRRLRRSHQMWLYYAVLCYSECWVGAVLCYDVLYMLNLTNTICGVRTYVTLTSMCDIGAVYVCARAYIIVAYA